MPIWKTSVGHHSKRITSHQAKKATTVQSLKHHNLSATQHRRRSWTPEQVFDGNYLKVLATVWKNIYDPTRTEWIDAAEDTLTSALATGALLSRPTTALSRCKYINWHLRSWSLPWRRWKARLTENYRHKWFWDKSIETKGRKDTYRYRVMDRATFITILPENEWYDPIEDDETKIKSLFVGLQFKEHSKYTTSPISKKRLWLHLSVVLLLRRICPDANMNTIQTADQWRQYTSPSIREGFSQIRKSGHFWLVTYRQPQKESENPGPTSPSLASVQDVGH